MRKTARRTGVGLVAAGILLAIGLAAWAQGENGKFAPADVASRYQQILNSPENHKREALGPDLARSGALDYARERAMNFATCARTDLQCLPGSPCRTILEMLTERVVNRES